MISTPVCEVRLSDPAVGFAANYLTAPLISYWLECASLDFTVFADLSVESIFQVPPHSALNQPLFSSETTPRLYKSELLAGNRAS
jgi:hypothetical protein